MEIIMLLIFAGVIFLTSICYWYEPGAKKAFFGSLGFIITIFILIGTGVIK